MDASASPTYLTIDELAIRIKYDSRSIREVLEDSVLIEGTYYIRPFGRRKILFIWEAIQRDMGTWSKRNAVGIPMANGALCHG